MVNGWWRCVTRATAIAPWPGHVMSRVIVIVWMALKIEIKRKSSLLIAPPPPVDHNNQQSIEFWWENFLQVLVVCLVVMVEAFYSHISSNKNLCAFVFVRVATIKPKPKRSTELAITQTIQRIRNDWHLMEWRQQQHKPLQSRQCSVMAKDFVKKNLRRATQIIFFFPFFVSGFRCANTSWWHDGWTWVKCSS